MFYPDLSKVTDVKTRNATVMPIGEKVRVVIDADAEVEIFNVKYVHAFNNMNRLVKVKKDSLIYG